MNIDYISALYSASNLHYFFTVVRIIKWLFSLMDFCSSIFKVNLNFIYTGWQEIYENNPRKAYKSSPAYVEKNEQNIIGGEACMWTETVSGRGFFNALICAGW